MKPSQAVRVLEEEAEQWRQRAEAAEATVLAYETREAARRQTAIDRTVGSWLVGFSVDGNDAGPMKMDDPRMFLLGVVDGFCRHPVPISLTVEKPPELTESQT